MNDHKYLKSLFKEVSNLKLTQANMQDPLFNLTQEQPIDLSLLLSPAQQSSSELNAIDGEGDYSSSTENIETLPEESISEMEEIVEELQDSDLKNEGTLAERIKQVEEEYNAKPIAISGKLRKRLLTMRAKLNISPTKSK